MVATGSLEEKRWRKKKIQSRNREVGRTVPESEFQARIRNPIPGDPKHSKELQH